METGEERKVPRGLPASASFPPTPATPSDEHIVVSPDEGDDFIEGSLDFPSLDSNDNRENNEGGCAVESSRPNAPVESKGLATDLTRTQLTAAMRACSSAALFAANGAALHPPPANDAATSNAETEDRGALPAEEPLISLGDVSSPAGGDRHAAGDAAGDDSHGGTVSAVISLSSLPDAMRVGVTLLPTFNGDASAAQRLQTPQEGPPSLQTFSISASNAALCERASPRQRSKNATPVKNTAERQLPTQPRAAIPPPRPQPPPPVSSTQENDAHRCDGGSEGKKHSALAPHRREFDTRSMNDNVPPAPPGGPPPSGSDARHFPHHTHHHHHRSTPRIQAAKLDTGASATDTNVDTTASQSQQARFDTTCAVSSPPQPPAAGVHPAQLHPTQRVRRNNSGSEGVFTQRTVVVDVPPPRADAEGGAPPLNAAFVRHGGRWEVVPRDLPAPRAARQGEHRGGGDVGADASMSSATDGAPSGSLSLSLRQRRASWQAQQQQPHPAGREGSILSPSQVQVATATAHTDSGAESEPEEVVMVFFASAAASENSK